jgi:predicted aminopeptidase
MSSQYFLVHRCFNASASPASPEDVLESYYCDLNHQTSFFQLTLTPSLSSIAITWCRPVRTTACVIDRVLLTPL